MSDTDHIDSEGSVDRAQGKVGSTRDTDRHRYKSNGSVGFFRYRLAIVAIISCPKLIPPSLIGIRIGM